MTPFLLFARLIVRPLLRERLRTALAVLVVAIGVAVVLAIEMAGEAAAGSFRSSVRALSGPEDFEVTSVGGVPAEMVAALATLPYPLQITPRIESIVIERGGRRGFTLLGLDLVHMATTGNARRGEDGRGASADGGASGAPLAAVAAGILSGRGWDENAVVVSKSVGRKAGDSLDLLVNDRPRTFHVAAVFDSGEAGDVILADLATADLALGRRGRVDLILVQVPPTPALEQWEARLRSALGTGVEVRRRGSATAENQRMLAAFRWNLRVLSYVALIVGAFLIYNTISVSVVRRRADIGTVRALGASRRMVLTAFLAEAALLGLAGAIAGLPLGRLMAGGAVSLIGLTVRALYVSSTPAPIALTPGYVLLALGVGVGVAVLSALSPAREAALVPPVNAMGRGRREFVVRVRAVRDLWLAVGLAVAAALAGRAPAIAGAPLAGYLAAILSVACCGLAIPALVRMVVALTSRWVGRVLGVEALLAARSLEGSLRRTSVLVAALATAVAMTTSVGIMVGSFRSTVLVWLNGALPADLYLSAAGGGPGRTIDPSVADRIERIPGVVAVDRFVGFNIGYGGRPATLAFFDARVNAEHGGLVFLSGRPAGTVCRELVGGDRVIVSEPFANKRHIRAGDVLRLPIGGRSVAFRVSDVYYDYTGERGFLIADRGVLMRYLPDAAPTTLAVYAKPNADLGALRAAVTGAAGESRVTAVANRDIRRMAVMVFDRTFAITYTLEAVSVFVAVMGIAGALLALVIDRRRELGLLRFLGASRSQVRRLILFEAGLLGLLSNLAGLLLGVALSCLLVFVINKQSFGWTIQFHWPVAVLLEALTIIYAATVVSAIYPAVVATRLNPIEVVHEE